MSSRHVRFLNPAWEQSQRAGSLVGTSFLTVEKQYIVFAITRKQTPEMWMQSRSVTKGAQAGIHHCANEWAFAKSFSFLTIVVLAGTVPSCTSHHDVRQQQSPIARYQSLAREKYGDGVDFVPNAMKTAVLCLKMPKPTSLLPQHRVSFFLFDLASDTILYEDNIPNGSVEWKDEFTILVNITPGNEKAEDVSPPTRHGYIYDIRIRKTRELNSAPVQ